MGDNSQIQWTDATWNVVTGCTRVSPGCANCYISNTFPFRSQHRQFERVGNEETTGVTLHPDRLDWPLKWKKSKKIFTPSLGDLFHEDVPDEFILRVFAVMGETPRHTYQLLTKRPERMLDWFSKVPDAIQYFADQCGVPYPEWPLPNVWLGVSVENQYWADQRIPLLLRTPAAVRFVSYEPALKPIDFMRIPLYKPTHRHDPEANLNALTSYITGIDEYLNNHANLDLVIVGGESGKDARPFDVQWARDTIRQCREASVACFVKQLGTVWAKENGAKDKKGGTIDEWPEHLRVREFPKVA